MEQLSVAAHPNRVRVYVMTLCLEWILFAFVLVGVRRHQGTVRIVLGDRWRSGQQLFRDSGIALGFWVVASGLLLVVRSALEIQGNNPAITAMLPHGALELALWIALSVTAGICEETIFRGYLQSQFMALTRNAPIGILLAAAAFGAAHAYQGYRMVLLITFFGMLFGSLSHWRRSVRPGMIAHAWQDSFSGVMAAILGH